MRPLWDHGHIYSPAERTAALQLAINRGGVIDLPQGRVRVKGHVYIPDRCVIRGAGKHLTTLKTDSGYFKSAGMELVSGITLSDLTCIGNGKAYPGGSKYNGYGFFASYVNDLTIERALFSNYANMQIMVNGSQNAIDGGKCHNLRFIDCDFRGTRSYVPGGGIQVSHGDGIQVRGCTFDRISRSVSFELNDNDTGQYVRNATITACNFRRGDKSQISDSNAYAGVALERGYGGAQALEDITITACTFDSGNKFKHANGFDIQCRASSVTINGCTFRGVENWSVSLYETDGCSVAGNVFNARDSSSFKGILVRGGNKATEGLSLGANTFGGDCKHDISLQGTLRRVRLSGNIKSGVGGGITWPQGEDVVEGP